MADLRCDESMVIRRVRAVKEDRRETSGKTRLYSLDAPPCISGVTHQETWS